MPIKTNHELLQPLLRGGYTLIPLHKYTRTSQHKNGKKRYDGKRPLHNDWIRRSYSSTAAVDYMRDEGGNVGVRLTANRLVVDVDPRNMPEGRDTFIELCEAVGLDTSSYPTVITGSGGKHVYMAKPADVAVVDSLEDFPGVEFKTIGRQVVAPGSIHPEAKALYEWDFLTIDAAEEPLDAPDRLMNLIRRPTVSTSGGGGGEYDQLEVSQMLDALDPEDFRSHSDWLSLMQACHHASGGDARSEFIEWSTRDAEYTDDAWLIGRRWDSLHRKTDGAAVTYRTLLKALTDAGKTDAIPRTPVSDDFATDPDADAMSRLPNEVPEHERKGPLEKMNDPFCLVNDNGRAVIYQELFDPVLDRHRWIRMAPHDFKQLLSNRAVEKMVPRENKDGEMEFKPKLVPIANEWLNWPGRRSADGVIFSPEKDYDGWMNLWTGWAVEPQSGDWSYMQELIRDVLCDGNEEAYQYVIKWIAHMVQKPWEPAGTALCFHGDKGTGKSTLGRALTSLAGRHGMPVTSSEHVTGRFNSHLMNVLMLFADEAVHPADRDGQNRLKTLITEPYLAFEAKGRDVIRSRNCMHVVMVSNSDWFVPMGTTDGERRYFVNRVNNSRQGDRTFFKKLNDQIYGDNKQGLRAMLYDLQLMDLNGWQPMGNIPHTDAATDQKIRNMSPTQQWWYDQLYEGVFSFEGARPWGLHRPEEGSKVLDWSTGGMRCFAQDVREDYENFMRRMGIRVGASQRGIQTTFGHELSKICPSLKKGRSSIPAERHMDLKAVGPSDKRRARAYDFPSLEVCRAEFEAAINAKIDWEENVNLDDVAFEKELDDGAF